MENFIIWSIANDRDEPGVTFFVYPVHVQRINQGTQEMIGQMLQDLGVSGATIKRWSVDHFITDYFTDYPHSQDWEANCGDAWEVDVELEEPASVESDATTVIPTWAFDETWEGNFSPYQLPGELLVVADFAHEELAAKAKRIIETSFPSTSVRQRQNLPKQLLISLGVFDEESFQEGADLATRVSTLCHQLEGTTSWREIAM